MPFTEYSTFCSRNIRTLGTLAAMPEGTPAPISRPLPTVQPARPVAEPRVVAEPRNLTVEVFRALADPIRLELLAQVAARGPLCVCHLQEELPYSQSRISKHLATLRQAGLVTTRREGTWIYYSVDEEALEIARDFIDQLERSLHTPHEADYCPPPG
jgi:ArsR family transcriptional regulator, arsenate/arsenite/antimonite-responsive transcriptional repressor